MYRVEKLKDCNRNGEVLSTSNLERLGCFITSNYSCKVVENSMTNTRNIVNFDTKGQLRKNSFVERTQPFGNFSKRNAAGCTNKSRFN